MGKVANIVDLYNGYGQQIKPTNVTTMRMSEIMVKSYL